MHAANPVPASLLDFVIATALQSGAKILEVYSSGDFETSLKKDDSPLTKADKLSHDFISRTLRGLTPDIPILSEESEDFSYQARRTWKHFWLVDPLDGTREFIKKNGEFAVNIALIENGRPILGVVYGPAKKRLYAAHRGSGAFCLDEAGNRRKISMQKPDAGAVRILLSRSQKGEGVQDFLKNYPGFSAVHVGSSLKFGYLAEGLADLYPRFWPSMEWDTAAGQCVVEEAGGFVEDIHGRALVYNKENLSNPYFVAGLRKVYNKK